MILAVRVILDQLMSNRNQAGNVILQRSASMALILTLGLSGCATKKSPPMAVPAAAQTSVTTPVAPAPKTADAAPDVLAQAAAQPSPPLEGDGWQRLFDGVTLTGWRETQFAGRGEVECRNGLMLLNMGDPFTGVNWTNDFPTMNYEVALDAMRVAGADFFCGLTVPVGNTFCSLIVGGWGGSLVGISSLDGMDASENETTRYMTFDYGHWYRIRLRVTPDRLEGWLDAKKIVDVVTTGKQISLRVGDIEMSKPCGLASWQTTAAYRNIQMRRVTGPQDAPKKQL